MTCLIVDIVIRQDIYVHARRIFCRRLILNEPRTLIVRSAMVQRRTVQLGMLLVLCYCAKLEANLKEYENCSYEYLDLVDDGVCDWENNDDACGWDGGDCCECTCNAEPCFSNIENGFDCLDPEAATDRYGCMKSPSIPMSCEPERQQNWVVENTTQAGALAKALNCSGGTFEVEWRGRVVIDRTLLVVGGTTLSVRGVGSSALMDGGGSIGLLTVSNSSLRVSNMILLSGKSISGGAIAALGSNIFLNHTKFVGNVAAMHGGALFIAGGSTLESRGDIGFFINGAGRRGGALCVSELSNVAFESRVNFSGNSASYGGAMSISSTSKVSWGGSAIFLSNAASSHGGALYVTANSRVSWEEQTTFANNSVYTLGGAVFVANGSKVSWNADTSFVANSGQYGGALCVVERSNVSWSGSTLFQYNTAVSGGAIIAAVGSRLELIGDTNFASNVARVDGGAISSTIASSVRSYTFSTEESSIIVIEGRTTFEFNKCGSNGGAVAISKLLSVEAANTAAMTFQGNIAGVYGGAVSIKTMTVGPVFHGALFEANFADSGGAVYVADSGTAESIDPNTGDTVEHWTVFNACGFKGNAASTIGGAILSPSGQNKIINSTFTGNVAFGGGALVFAGSAYVASCSFHGNVADIQGGLAIYNIGDITGLVNITFGGNLPRCSEGSFADSREVSHSVASDNPLLSAQEARKLLTSHPALARGIK